MTSCDSSERFTCSSCSCGVTRARFRNDVSMDLPIDFLMSNDTMKDTILEVCGCKCFDNGHPLMILMISKILGCLFGNFCLCYFCSSTKNVDFYKCDPRFKCCGHQKRGGGGFVGR